MRPIFPGLACSAISFSEACARALKFNAVSWSSLQSILKNGLDLEPLNAHRTLDLPEHENLRGAGYYQSNHLH